MFARFLKIKRAHKTQKDFCKELGIGLSLYVALESGQRQPSKNVLAIIKKIYPETDINIFFT